MAELSEQKPIVIDNGSGVVKAGYGGDDHPCSVFPTIIGKPKNPDIQIGESKDNNEEDYLFGVEA